MQKQTNKQMHFSCLGSICRDVHQDQGPMGANMQQQACRTKKGHIVYWLCLQHSMTQNRHTIYSFTLRSCFKPLKVAVVLNVHILRNRTNKFARKYYRNNNDCRSSQTSWGFCGINYNFSR